MGISGAVPYFDISTCPEPTDVVVTVTGTEADSQATGTNSNETLQAFLQRGINALSVSGVLDATSGATSGMQCLSGSVLSGIMHYQQELAFRVGDLLNPAGGNASRLAQAQAALAVSGQVQFGA